MTTGPAGAGYTYGDANHLDAVTSAPNYTASYDDAGGMVTRNGQAMTYDALRRLLTWQNTASNPTQTASYAYDGEGNRVQQVSTASGTTTTTTYIGNTETVAVSGTTTQTTLYYPAGAVTAVSVNGTLSYLIGDSLGSVSVALDTAGQVTSTALYSPYGATRYHTGTMPTARGFTSMVGDPSGLLYDHARYYDGVVGQFTTADIAQGLNRYGYVAGNPETLTDPTGQMIVGYTPQEVQDTRQEIEKERAATTTTTTTTGGNGGSGDTGKRDNGCADCESAKKALESVSSIFSSFVYGSVAVVTGIFELMDALRVQVIP
jgi:RHS repeat-associated protein